MDLGFASPQQRLQILHVQELFIIHFWRLSKIKRWVVFDDSCLLRPKRAFTAHTDIVKWTYTFCGSFLRGACRGNVLLAIFHNFAQVGFLWILLELRSVLNGLQLTFVVRFASLPLAAELTWPHIEFNVLVTLSRKRWVFVSVPCTIQLVEYSFETPLRFLAPLTI